MSRSFKTPVDKSKGRQLKTPIYNRNIRNQIHTQMTNIDENYIDEEFDIDEEMDDEFLGEDEE